ncbi:MAG: alpha/beta hydrolase [Ilumatobacteraceae bacterium]
MGYADVNGQRIYFEDTGGEGAPVILGHGFLMDHEMFAPQVAALAPQYRVITWDERGFGQTEYDGEPFSYWDSARLPRSARPPRHRARRRRRDEPGRVPVAARRAHRTRAGARPDPARHRGRPA